MGVYACVYMNVRVRVCVVTPPDAQRAYSVPFVPAKSTSYCRAQMLSVVC